MLSRLRNKYVFSWNLFTFKILRLVNSVNPWTRMRRVGVTIWVLLVQRIGICWLLAITFAWCSLLLTFLRYLWALESSQEHGFHRRVAIVTTQQSGSDSDPSAVSRNYSSSDLFVNAVTGTSKRTPYGRGKGGGGTMALLGQSVETLCQNRPVEFFVAFLWNLFHLPECETGGKEWD
jgi:hypothetical protein